MLSVVYAEGCEQALYAKCRCAEGRAECRNAECRGAQYTVTISAAKFVPKAFVLNATLPT